MKNAEIGAQMQYIIGLGEVAQIDGNGLAGRDGLAALGYKLPQRVEYLQLHNLRTIIKIRNFGKIGL